MDPRLSNALGRLNRSLRSPYLLAAASYLALAALVFRNGGFGATGSLPVGTNALNTWLSAWYFGNHPLSVWIYPFTDWGQPVPGFTGPTVFTAFAALLAPTQLVRGLEFVCVPAAGLSMMWATRRLDATFLASSVAGGYYAIVAETAQLFEGHVQAMISIALAPAFFVAVWQFVGRPTVRLGVVSAVLFYLLVSIGDLGLLYFYLFFALPMAIFGIGRRLYAQWYRWAEVVALLTTGAFAVVLCLSWLVPFAGGARAEYTTNITTGVLPFSATTGENVVFGFTGYVQDDSFIHFTYHQMFYSAGGLAYLPAFLIVPVVLGAYALTSGKVTWVLTYGAGILALLFSTGHLYGGVGAFNGWVYAHLPYFDAIPALFRWVDVTILVYGVLLGWFLTALERRAPWSVTAARRILARRLALATRGRRATAARANPPEAAPRVPRAHARVGITTVAVLVVGVVLLQNWTLIAEPPGTFRFPAQYTSAYAYLEDRPLSGEVLEIPFGGIYDRAPWSGVSASAALLTPAYTGADTAILEAGTPASLALDEFIGNGLTNGGSRNMTKFLGSANVQYIVATDYSNWSYSSSSEYSPKLSFESLSNQTGLGPQQPLSSAQSVYQPGNWAGNLSFHRSFLLYFGGDSILYSVLDSPWYPGPSMALVNGSSVGSALPMFVAHASGIVLTPAALASLGQTFVDEASDEQIPLIEIIPPAAYIGTGVTLRPDAWNATGGTDLQFATANATATVDLNSYELSTAGYAKLTLTGQLAAPPGATVSLGFGNTTERTNLSLSSVEAQQPVNVTAPDFLLESADNQTANYSAPLNVTSVNGTTWVHWQPELGFSSDQYLGFNLTHLSGWSGLEFTARGAPNLTSLAIVLCAAKTCYAMAPVAIAGPPGSNETLLRFLLPSGLVGLPYGLAPRLGNLTSVAIRWMGPATPAGLAFSNLTLVQVSTPGLVTRLLGLVPTSTNQFDISLPPTSRLGFLEISTGSLPVSGTYVRDLDAQPDATSWRFAASATGWGVLTMAQTYSSQWTLSGPGPSYLSVADVGLTGWLINDSGSAVWTVAYAGDALEHVALIAEATGLTVLAVAAIVTWVRRFRAKGPVARPTQQ